MKLAVSKSQASSTSAESNCGVFAVVVAVVEEADEPLFLLRTGLVRLRREHQMQLEEAGDG